MEKISFGDTDVDKIRKEQEFERELKALSERKRRKYERESVAQ